MLESSVMSPLTLLVLRRLSALALVLAGLLVVVFRVLPAFGLMGPGLPDELEAAARAIEAGRAYGASEDLAPYKSAVRGLARAREMATAGKGLEARRAARAARLDAVEAQRLALTQREAARRDAERITFEIDRHLSDLEGLYTEVSIGLPKDEVSRLLSLMKNARRSGAGLYLAYEGKDYGRVIAEEAATLKLLDETKGMLAAARTLPHAVPKRRTARDQP